MTRVMETYISNKMVDLHINIESMIWNEGDFSSCIALTSHFPVALTLRVLQSCIKCTWSSTVHWIMISGASNLGELPPTYSPQMKVSIGGAPKTNQILRSSSSFSSWGPFSLLDVTIIYHHGTLYKQWCLRCLQHACIYLFEQSSQVIKHPPHRNIFYFYQKMNITCCHVAGSNKY